jgi:hypothetical protein
MQQDRLVIQNSNRTGMLFGSELCWPGVRTHSSLLPQSGSKESLAA